MKSLKLKKIVNQIGGKIVQGSKETVIKNVSYFPSDVEKDTLYFDMPHPYSQIPFGPLKKRPGVIISTSPSKFSKRVHKKTTIVKVDNSSKAYWKFVRYYRRLFDVPIIGVTGTCGKTTTTEMIKSILSTRYRVHGTIDGKNNLNYNLPYLLGINEKTEAAVFEMGVTHPGCITDSCRHFQPQVGIILNIGVYHLLGCQTFEQYVAAKAEMIQGIVPGGTLVINSDDPHIRQIDLRSFQGKVVTFGMGLEADYRATHLKYTDEGMSFILHVGSMSIPLVVHGHGEENVYNALASIAAVHAIGMDLRVAGDGLATFKQVRQHLELRQGPGGSTIIDDTWNCTPPSVNASLKVLDNLARGRNKVAVIGYMPQLGESGQQEYDKIAERVIETGVDWLILIGEAERVGKRAIQLGMDPRHIRFCQSGYEVSKALEPFLNERNLILYKFPYKYRLSAFPTFRQLMKETLGYE